MANKIQCAAHGESHETFVYTHLLGETVGLGFNRSEPTAENPFPDAWCDDCELISAAHGGWNEQSENLAKISMLCSGSYERARIRNTRTSVNDEDFFVRGLIQLPIIGTAKSFCWGVRRSLSRDNFDSRIALRTPSVSDCQPCFPG